MNLHYRERVSLPLLRGDYCLCFSKPGRFFSTEALCFIYGSRPRRHLRICYVASPLEPTVLASRGLSGNAIVETPFDYQFTRLGRRATELLPKDIILGDFLKWDDLFRRIEGELAAIEQDLWKNLEARWKKVQSQA